MAVQETKLGESLREWLMTPIEKLDLNLARISGIRVSEQVERDVLYGPGCRAEKGKSPNVRG